ncbi:hypothetical protein QYF61_003269 [Mycteria americana]|uniref:Uncharacterized protein n=1 Tax=Mycteria americana TaxID=33587 RepID=A0AAN7PB91_MYCAM|nr:hypothetical protein QYF61_003269 [Mycteria americana]
MGPSESSGKMSCGRRKDQARFRGTRKALSPDSWKKGNIVPNCTESKQDDLGNSRPATLSSVARPPGTQCQTCEGQECCMLFSSTMGFFSTGDVGLASARPSKPLEMSSKVLPLVSGTLKNEELTELQQLALPHPTRPGATPHILIPPGVSVGMPGFSHFLALV